MQNHQTKFGRALAILMSLVMALSVVLVNPVDVQAASKKVVKKLTVSAKNASTIEVGKTATATATVKSTTKLAQKDKTFKVSVKSSDESIAKVSVKNPSGKKKAKSAKTTITVTAVKAGTATITVKTKGKNKKKKVLTKTFSVTVTDGTTVPGTKITVPAGVSPTAPAVAKGQTVQLTTTEKGATWKSQNTAVATVDSTGKVTGVANGTVKIDLVDSTGKVIDTIEFKVGTGVADQGQGPVSGVTSITLDKDSYTVETGKSVTALATVVPASAQGSVKFTTPDSKLITVTDAGVIIAGETVGNTTITASCGGKTVTAKVYVVGPTAIELTPAKELSLAIGESATIKSSVDGVTWSSDKSEIADVSDAGLVTGKAVGTAVITASKNGITADVTVTVTQYSAKTEGTTLSVYNPISNNDDTVLTNTRLVNQDLIIRAQVQKNQAGVKNAMVKLSINPIDKYIVDENDFEIQYANGAKYALTDENGIAFITIAPVNPNIPSTYDDYFDCPYISFNVSSEVNGDAVNDRDITIKFGSVLRNGIYVDNNDVRNVRSKAESPKDYVASDYVLPEENHIEDEELLPINPWKEIPAVNNDDGIQQSWNTNDHYPVQYVSSQQYPGEVRLSATPYFILPPDREASVEDLQINFNGKDYNVVTNQKDVSVAGPVTIDSYSIYNDGADLTTTTSVTNIPAGLVSMSVAFKKMDISKYSKMYIDLYECDDDGVITKRVTGEEFAGEDWYYDKNDAGSSVQLSMSETKNKGILVISIQSPGQVDVGTEGYTLMSVTGTFNKKRVLDPERIEVVKSVTWTDVTDKASYSEPRELSYAQVEPYLEDYKTVKNSFVTNDPAYTFYYRVPAFNSGLGANALTGNAIITARYTDGTRVEEVNYAYPCIRKEATWDYTKQQWNYENVNELMPQPAPMNTAGHIKAVMLGSDVIDKNNRVKVKTAGIKTEGNQAIVTPGSSENGILFAEAKININALQNEIKKAENLLDYDLSPLKGADKQYPLYTFVEYVPRPKDAIELGTPPTFYALEDQFVEVTAEVMTELGSMGTYQDVTFYDINGNEITEANVGDYYPLGAPSGPVIKYIDPQTGKDGKARLILQATEGAVADGIKVKYTATEEYDVFNTYVGDQKFEPTLVAKDKSENICNVEWFDLGLSYLDSVVPIDTKVTGTWVYQYPSDGVAKKESTSVVEKNWKVGFLPAAESATLVSDYETLFAMNRDPFPVPKNIIAEIEGVGVDYGFLDSNDPVKNANCTALKAGAEGDTYETVKITSKKTGTTQVTGTLRVDKEQCKINYYDDLGIYHDGEKGSENEAIFTVGVNSVTFDDQNHKWDPKFGGNIQYTMTWEPAEMIPSFVHPFGYGVATSMGKNSTFYFKVVDKLGNPIVGKDVIVEATRDGIAYGAFTAPNGLTTDAFGLVAINVPDQAAECVMNFTVYDASHKLILNDQDITYSDVPATTDPLKIAEEPKVVEDSQDTVTLFFNNNIDLSSIPSNILNNVLNELFIVKDSKGNVITIKSVTVNKYAVQIETEKAFSANASYTIEIKDGGVLKNGVTYVLRDVHGQAILAANNNKTFTCTIDVE